VATLRGGSVPTALLVAPWGDRLGPFWRTAVTQAIARSAPWCLLFNGTHLRTVDARRLYTRRYIDVHLGQALDNPQTFAALLALASARGLADPDSNRPLGALVDASDRHASGVCRSLKNGVLTASADVLNALVRPRVMRTLDLRRARVDPE